MVVTCTFCVFYNYRQLSMTPRLVSTYNILTYLPLITLLYRHKPSRATPPRTLPVFSYSTTLQLIRTPSVSLNNLSQLPDPLVLLSSFHISCTSIVFFHISDIFHASELSSCIGVMTFIPVMFTLCPS